jgi:hypothetical protein
MTDEAIHKSPLQAAPDHNLRAHGSRTVIGQSKSRLLEWDDGDRERQGPSRVDEWCKFSAI